VLERIQFVVSSDEAIHRRIAHDALCRHVASSPGWCHPMQGVDRDSSVGPIDPLDPGPSTKGTPPVQGIPLMLARRLRDRLHA
jgi:hypothetical protein